MREIPFNRRHYINLELPADIERLNNQAETIAAVANDIKATMRPSLGQAETFYRHYNKFWVGYFSVERRIAQLSPQHIEENRALIGEFQQLSERVI